MSENKDKKEYQKPTVTKVVLNSSQAILSICSTTGSSAKTTGTGATCRKNNCKKKGRGGDSGPAC